MQDEWGYLLPGATLFIAAATASTLIAILSNAMATLGRLRKEHMFLWAWGINGCFSVRPPSACRACSTSARPPISSPSPPSSPVLRPANVVDGPAEARDDLVGLARV